MVTMEDIKKGMYRGVPESLYPIMVQSTIQKDKVDKLTFRIFHRPGPLEDDIRFYRVKGLKFYHEDDPDVTENVFTRSYRLEVNIPEFLHDCGKFYSLDASTVYDIFMKMLMEEIKREAPKKEHETPDAILKRLVKKKHPRDNGVIVFKRKITDDPFKGNTY